MSVKLRVGGPVLRSAGRVDGLAGRNGACGASAKPAAADRLVSGVPPARSAGGGAGLPDLPREARGRGVVSETRAFGVSADADGPDLGGRGMGGIWRPSPAPATDSFG